MLARVPPSGDPIILELGNGNLKIGNSSSTCVHVETEGGKIELPLNPTPLLVLQLVYRYTPADIEKSGLAKPVAEAEEWRDKLIAGALASLREFGVTQQELRNIVDEKMRAASR